MLLNFGFKSLMKHFLQCHLGTTSAQFFQRCFHIKKIFHVTCLLVSSDWLQNLYISTGGHQKNTLKINQKTMVSTEYCVTIKKMCIVAVLNCGRCNPTKLNQFKKLEALISSKTDVRFSPKILNSKLNSVQN